MLKMFWQDKIMVFDPSLLPLETVVKKSCHQQAVSSHPSAPHLNAFSPFKVIQLSTDNLF